jgi:hypothetical protein
MVGRYIENKGLADRHAEVPVFIYTRERHREREREQCPYLKNCIEKAVISDIPKARDRETADL